MSKIMVVCKDCGETTNHYAKGLCRTCYDKQYIPIKWSRYVNQCVNCGTNSKPHKAKGLCEPCYDVQPSTHLCACGCGQHTVIRRGVPTKYAKGHWLKDQSQESRDAKHLSRNSEGSNNPCYGKFGKDHPAYGHYTTPETRELRRQTRLKYISERHTKPTNIEIILATMLDNLHLKHLPQQLLHNKFTVDEYLPEHTLVIEAYGDYWHANPAVYSEDVLADWQKKALRRDEVRTKYLETCEYKVLILWEHDLIHSPEMCIQQIQLNTILSH